MRHPRIAIVLACLLAGGCVPQVAAEQPDQQPMNQRPPNPPISASLTCGEFVSLLQSKDRAAGLAIWWLDGYYSGRASLPGLPAGWIRTVSQGLGGTCAISVNASRPVLDVIAQLHREYGGAMAAKP
jgi:hypothetical protein